MKSKITKTLCLVMGAILLVTGTVAVTLAYLQDKTQAVTNTMTVGKVDIKLDEAEVDAKGVATSTRTEKGNTYKLIPGSTYDKDPKITVLKGSEPCWVFFGVSIDTKVSNVLDTSNNVIATQLKNNGWLELQTADKTQITYTDTENGVTTQYKIYYKSTAVDASTADKPLATFTKFSVSTTADVSKADKATIKVKAFAVQSANLDTPQDAWDGAFKQVAG